LRILQINSVVNTGSTGRITEEIGNELQHAGHESFIGYGRQSPDSSSISFRIGNDKNMLAHGAKSLFLDRHGFASKKATQQLIKEIDRISPDAIGLHNLHGYYLHIGVLFEYLAASNIPVLWTLFDCWAFTGHCTYFDDIACEKWQTGCHSCPKLGKYPKSIFLDNSKRNYLDKQRLFGFPENLEIIVHSEWLAGLLDSSFLGNRKVHLIKSGIDLSVFRLHENVETEKTILGVASTWDDRKGLKDFLSLREILDTEYNIVLIGLSPNQIRKLPLGITGIARTESLNELVKWYNRAMVFVNPTWQDNFPTTNLEALACGTSVITYNTGGSPEAIDSATGFVVEKGDIQGIKEAINIIADKGKDYYVSKCRTRAERLFDKRDRYKDYIDLYQKIIDKNKVEI
jgi:putative colanic acid biosynthesis glycosyltransferase